MYMGMNIWYSTNRVTAETIKIVERKEGTFMKRKLLSIGMAMILALALSINASAGTSGKSGETSGGTYGKLNVSASLVVYSTSARASTNVPSVSGVTASTSLVYYCILSSGGITTVPGTGTDTDKGANNVGVMGYYGESYHNVGGSAWGVWGCQLSTGV